MNRSVLNPTVRWRSAAMALLIAAMGSARAHDTWFQRHPQATPQRPAHFLGTGDQFPVYDSRNSLDHLVRSGCRAGTSQVLNLSAMPTDSESLVVVPHRDLAPAARVSCWAQSQEFEVELDDELVERYFKEALPSQAVRQAWADQRSRGQRWRERYVKHARVEWFPDPSAVDTAPAQASPMDFDALMLQPLRAARVGDELEFQVIRNGRPMAMFPVEFRHHASRFGLWRRTDENGRVRLRAPSPGRWLLRGIELTPPASQPSGADADVGQGRWQGHFIALSFDVLSAQP